MRNTRPSAFVTGYIPFENTNNDEWWIQLFPSEFKSSIRVKCTIGSPLKSDPPPERDTFALLPTARLRSSEW